MQNERKKSNVKPNEKRTVVITMLVDGGVDNALVARMTGAQIDELETLINRLIDETEQGSNK